MRPTQTRCAPNCHRSPNHKGRGKFSLVNQLTDPHQGRGGVAQGKDYRALQRADGVRGALDMNAIYRILERGV
mgnify:CR=1 FL=1